MGWFSNKPTHKDSVQRLNRLTADLWCAADRLPLSQRLHIEGPRERLRYYLFCLSVVQVGCASKMANPDAVLNEMCHHIVRLTLSDEGQAIFAGPKDGQEAANLVSSLMQDFLHRWSVYIEILAGGNAEAALAVLYSMLHDVESASAGSGADGERLSTIALWYLQIIDRLRASKELPASFAQLPYL